jgi:hypothetical protein
LSRIQLELGFAIVVEIDHVDDEVVVEAIATVQSQKFICLEIEFVDFNDIDLTGAVNSQVGIDRAGKLLMTRETPTFR